MRKVGEGELVNDYLNVHADPQWYGCEVPEEFKEWKRLDKLPDVEEGVRERVRKAVLEFVDKHDFEKETLAVLRENWNEFELHKVISANLEEVNNDIQCTVFIHPESKQTVLSDLSRPNHKWDDQPWNALETAAVVDVANGGQFLAFIFSKFSRACSYLIPADLESILPLFNLAHRVVSMAYVGGKYQVQAVAVTDTRIGERIVLCSLLVGLEQIKLGYNQFWVRKCPNLRLMTYRSMCGMYSRGVLAHGDCTLRKVFDAGHTTHVTGNVLWSRVRAAMTHRMPHELREVIERNMKEVRSHFVYPNHSQHDVDEMRAWCDVTTFDWYALCGPSAENVSPAALGCLMLGYECEVLVDMCPNVTYVDYMAFIAAGVDVIPHMDSKELVAGAFAAHACGVKGFPGLYWLHKCVNEHAQKGRSMWAPRCLDGAAYLMFHGINEGSRQQAVPYGDVRIRAEINVMAAHEVAGLFRHGMEGDAVSRSMLDEDANIASFAKMIDTIAENTALIGRDMGPPHSTGFMLTSYGYLLFNFLGCTGMLRWAAKVIPRCESIAQYADTQENTKLPSLSPEEVEARDAKAKAAMTRDMSKVSTLAAHRALRLGIETDYVDTHQHVPGDIECVCWECLAGDDTPCSCH